jgi:transcriptional regulator with XRE-family HTH domain
MEIGHVIAQLRSERKISQRQLASALNVSAGVVGLWETGKRFPSYECIIALADYFMISTDTLLAKDRTLRADQYSSSIAALSPDIKKMIAVFTELNEDNKDIIMGKIKELLKEQRKEERYKENPSRTAKAT